MKDLCNELPYSHELNFAFRGIQTGTLGFSHELNFAFTGTQSLDVGIGSLTNSSDNFHQICQ